MNIPAAEVREGDFVWNTPASASVVVREVKTYGNHVEIRGEYALSSAMLGDGAMSYHNASDTVRVAR